MSNWLANFGAWLIRATTVIDRGHLFFQRVRARLVLALASDAVLDRYNDLAYGAMDSYRPDHSTFRHRLFSWEASAIDRFFPPPPARVLIGGAGGGREAFALAARGYQVVAFEPSRSLVESMARHVPAGARVEVYQAGYEQLPSLRPLQSGEPIERLDCMSAFDAAIVGWSSLSHLRTDKQRVETLRAFARVTQGPVLVSFFGRRDTSDLLPGKRHRLRRLLPSRRQPGDAFGIAIGHYYQFSPSEIRQLALQSGFTIVHLCSEDDGTSWPHAVLVPDTSVLVASPASSPL
jgi:SAM-dependent methyltransferase